MKKLLGIVVLVLTWCNVGFAEDLTEQNKAFLKMLCSNKTIKKNQKLIEDCKKYFPTNNVQKQKDGIDVVCPSRFLHESEVRGYPWLKYLVVRTAAFMLYHMAFVPIHDPTNGFRLFSRKEKEDS